MYKGKHLVSIIVPVYNAEKYLCKCVDSILAQTYTYWELLLIDDGSSDNSWSICESYTKKDDRIIAIHKDNSGVSDTRNVGIVRSTGENICFIDADDWVKPKFIEHLMQFSEVDYVIAGYETWPENSRCILKARAYNRNEMPIMFDEYLQTRPTSCATLFKASIIKEHQVQFTSKLRSREDHLFNVQYLRWINTSYSINFQEYVVRSRREPIAIKFRMHSADIELVVNSLLKGYKDIEERFGYKVKDLRPTLNVISQYYLEDFIHYNSDEDYFGLYKKFYSHARKEDMYADKNLSSINLLLDGIIAYRQINNSAKMKELINLFGHIFINVTLENASFRSNYYRIIADSIMAKDLRKADRYINKVNRANQTDYYIKKALRPFVYLIKTVL